jgi:hypothetical protein
MGNTISLQFVNGADESVVLFSHWDGRELLEEAQLYVKELKEENRNKNNSPLEKLEPQTVMVDFIRHLTRFLTKNEQRVESNYYLRASSTEGDNTNNGHWKIDLRTGIVK